MTLRLLSYNIRFGGTGRVDALGEVLRTIGPDVVLLQEATDPAAVAAIAAAAQYPHYGARAGQSAGFLSRRPVSQFAWHYLPQARHAVLEVELTAEARGEATHLYSLHLTPWFSNWFERRRTREITTLLASIQSRKEDFHLIAGDFNALAPGERLDPSHMPRWIRAMLWMSGNDIARTTIQAMLDAGYVDAWRSANDGQPPDSAVTFPVWEPHVRLDYVFLPEKYAKRIERCAVMREPSEVKGASDHFPLLVELAEA